MIPLTPGSIVEVDGIRIRVGSVTGSAETRPDAPGTRASGGDDDELLDHARKCGASVTRTLVLDDLALQAPPAGIRTSAAPNILVLQPPDPGSGYGEVVYARDENGVVEILFPDDEVDDVPADGDGSRGVGPARRQFTLHLVPDHIPSSEGEGARSVAGAIVKRVLRVLVFPILQPLIQATARAIARGWEDTHRVSLLRDFTPGEHSRPLTRPVDIAQLARSANSGRLLLMIHGTFSTTYGCFGDLDAATVGALQRRYGGLVAAFDHPTLSVDPDANAMRLLEALAPAGALDIDIVCHSRGGLVSRALARLLAAADGTQGAVRSILHVATPNHGTPLIDTPRMKQFLDAYANLLVAAPTSTALDIVAGVWTAIEEIAAGTVDALPGLLSMHPTGTYLTQLAATQPAIESYAIASDFSPEAGSPLSRVATFVADRVVTAAMGASNDLVVPTQSTLQGIAPDRAVLLRHRASVTHTQYFGSPTVNRTLRKWLCV